MVEVFYLQEAPHNERNAFTSDMVFTEEFILFHFHWEVFFEFQSRLNPRIREFAKMRY